MRHKLPKKMMMRKKGGEYAGDEMAEKKMAGIREGSAAEERGESAAEERAEKKAKKSKKSKKSK